MRARECIGAVALLFLLPACAMPDTCKIGEEADCPPEAVCYGGEGGEAGARGVCVYGELSSEGKLVPKIMAWRLVLPDATEIQPLRWDERDGKENRENANAGWVGMLGALVEAEVAGMEEKKELKVLAGGVEADCKPQGKRKPEGELWACTLKEGWAFAQPTSETIEVEAQAGDADARVRTYRVLCSHNLEGLVDAGVNAPLAMSGKRLLVGSGPPPGPPGTSAPHASDAPHSLYAFDTTSCALVGSLHTGTVQGPMVALGDTGRVAVATGGKEEQRLSLVNVSEAEPYFVANKECVQEGVVFEHGFSLLSLSDAATGEPWRLVAPANNLSGNTAWLVAYTPDAISTSERCAYSTLLSHSFPMPMSQYADGTLIAAYNSSSGARYEGWSFNKSFNSAWSGRLELDFSIENIAPIALDGNDGWVPMDLSLGSPDVVDSRNRGYHAISPPDRNDYHLHRFRGGHLEICNEDYEFQGAPVGSPILGEPVPGDKAEIYVVTATGWVLAYGAELGEPLWTYNLGIGIARTAQPVLSGDTLWVVGAHGEIRGIRVKSNGLNRNAFWPKLFRDNCNTSSHLSTPDSLPSCF